MFYVDVQLQGGARLHVPAEYGEQAIYVVQGRLDLGMTVFLMPVNYWFSSQGKA
jgi:redox-sensitive bicupin YhaK (pirin superfamily)